MTEPYIGELRCFGFNFAPSGWAQCNGQQLPIQQNTALFSLLGTTYGGDGRTTFGLPDLRGRTALGSGQALGAVLSHGVTWRVLLDLLLIGAFGVMRSRNLIHAVLCLSVSQSGTYVLLLAIGYQSKATPPVFGEPASAVTTSVVDPVVQAMSLTDIVVSGGTAQTPGASGVVVIDGFVVTNQWTR